MEATFPEFKTKGHSEYRPADDGAPIDDDGQQCRKYRANEVGGMPSKYDRISDETYPEQRD